MQYFLTYLVHVSLSPFHSHTGYMRGALYCIGSFLAFEVFSAGHYHIVSRETFRFRRIKLARQFEVVIVFYLEIGTAFRESTKYTLTVSA